MLNIILADFYERDIRKLISEIKLFKNEETLWKTQGSVNNAAGNLVLHIIGGTNYLIGATLAQTGYTRNRELEFSSRNISREILVTQLEALIPMIKKTLTGMTDEQMHVEYPMIFDDAKRPNSYVLTQLLLHLNYHLGQVNYLRRILE